VTWLAAPIDVSSLVVNILEDRLERGEQKVKSGWSSTVLRMTDEDGGKVGEGGFYVIQLECGMWGMDLNMIKGIFFKLLQIFKNFDYMCTYSSRDMYTVQ
jgi:hypothetical protein